VATYNVECRTCNAVLGTIESDTPLVIEPQPAPENPEDGPTPPFDIVDNDRRPYLLCKTCALAALEP